MEVPVKNRDLILYAKVDKEDYDKIKDIKWNIFNGYALSSVGRMHRFILGATKTDPIVDHINNDRLDNRKVNLRFTSASKNNQNKKKKEGCTSEYLGVSYHKSGNKWRCAIQKINK